MKPLCSLISALRCAFCGPLLLCCVKTCVQCRMAGRIASHHQSPMLFPRAFGARRVFVVCLSCEHRLESPTSSHGMTTRHYWCLHHHHLRMVLACTARPPTVQYIWNWYENNYISVSVEGWMLTGRREGGSKITILCSWTRNRADKMRFRSATFFDTLKFIQNYCHGHSVFRFFGNSGHSKKEIFLAE